MKNEMFYYVDDDGYLNIYVCGIIAFKVCQCGNLTNNELEDLVDNLMIEGGFNVIRG